MINTKVFVRFDSIAMAAAFTRIVLDERADHLIFSRNQWKVYR